MSEAALHYDGRLAMLVDGHAAGGRGQGLLFVAARDVTDAEIVAIAGQGGVCTVTINETSAMRLGLVPQGHPPRADATPYFVNSVEARACSETGISARERALTMRTLGQADVTADDVQSPGHIMVQVARNVLREDATLPEIANLLLSATTDTRFAGWGDVLDAHGEVASAEHCLALAEDMSLTIYDAQDVSVRAREILRPWVAAMDFTRERFGG